MANSFARDLLLQAEDPKQAARFYVEQLGFEVTGEQAGMVSLEGREVNLYIEQGPALGPVLEVMVTDVAEAKARLLANGCEIVKDEPEVPRCYMKDAYGLIYNLRFNASK